RTANPTSGSPTNTARVAVPHNQTDLEFVRGTKEANTAGADVPSGSANHVVPGAPGGPRSLVDESREAGSGEEHTETGTEEPTSGSESAGPAERRAQTNTLKARPISAAPNTPPAVKWEL